MLLIVVSVAARATRAQAQQKVPASDTTAKTVIAIGYPLDKSGEVDLTGTELMAQGE
jgi:hypothetical protein